MTLWMKIGSAVLLGLMIAMLLPRLREVTAHAPRGDDRDWAAVILPLGLVIAFVAFLLWLV